MAIDCNRLPTDFSKPILIDLPITIPGVFHYYIEYEASTSHHINAQPVSNGFSNTNDSSNTNGSINGSSHIKHSSLNKKSKRVRSATGAFNVDPVLNIPKRSPILSDDSSPLSVAQGGARVLKESVQIEPSGLVIQTVIAKWMGTIDKWDNYLDCIRDRGYNMLHLTPLQTRGESNSPYSIYDQMSFDDSLFLNGAQMSVQEKQKSMKVLLDRIRKKWGILSLTDFVWNHTANNSFWLQDHPEAGEADNHVIV